MTIVSVKVARRNPRQVIYVPYWVVDKIKAPDNCALISISNSDHEIPGLRNFPEGVPALYFKNAQDPELDPVLAFIEQHQPHNVVVHCVMGMQRSPWVAKHLMKRFGFLLAEGIALEDDGYWPTERYEQNKNGF